VISPRVFRLEQTYREIAPEHCFSYSIVFAYE